MKIAAKATHDAEPWFPTTLKHCCWNDTEALRLRAALEAEPSEEELRGEG
jgi:hypothetical protein